MRGRRSCSVQTQHFDRRDAPTLPITPRTHTSAVAKTLFSGAYIGVDGEETAVQAAQEIAQSLGGTVFLLHGVDRALYHAAAVITSNFLVTLAAQATKPCRPQATTQTPCLFCCL